MSLDIEQLDDATALRLLQTVARAQPEGEVPSVGQLTQALPPPISGAAGDSRVGEADLARATLTWLAGDPRQRQGIETLAAGPAPMRYTFDPGLGALMCVLLLLKAKAVIERDKDGRWHFRAELIELKQGPLGAVLDLFAKLANRR